MELTVSDERLCYDNTALNYAQNSSWRRETPEREQSLRGIAQTEDTGYVFVVYGDPLLSRHVLRISPSRTELLIPRTLQHYDSHIHSTGVNVPCKESLSRLAPTTRAYRPYVSMTSTLSGSMASSVQPSKCSYSRRGPLGWINDSLISTTLLLFEFRTRPPCLPMWARNPPSHQRHP